MSQSEPQIPPGAPSAEATSLLEPSEAASQTGPTANVPDDAQTPIVPVPVPAHLRQPSSTGAAARPAGTARQDSEHPSDGSSDGLGSAPQHEEVHAKAGLLQRVLRAVYPSRRRTRRPQGQSEPSNADSEDKPGKVIVLLDFALRVINRPFAFLSPGARQVIGLTAIVTLAIAAVTAALAPLAPRNDPVTFVRQKRAELDQPPPPPPAHAEQKPAESEHQAGH
jgi:hypothetical protein